MMESFCDEFTSFLEEELDYPLLSNKVNNLNLDFFPDDSLENKLDPKTDLALPEVLAPQKEQVPLNKAPLITTPIVTKRKERRRASVPHAKPIGRTRASTQPNASTSTGKEARWKSWAHEEEVFLVGSVMDRFFRRGSLSSTRGTEDTGTDDCWAFIKASYDKAWEKYTLRTGEKKPTERSVAALSRHYKVMKARISAADLQGDSSESFREYYNEFEMLYNINNSLLGNQDAAHVASPLNRIDRRKRKVRLSFNSRNRFDATISRRDSTRSVASCGTLESTSSTGSFIEEGGYVIKDENKFDEEEEYE